MNQAAEWLKLFSSQILKGRFEMTERLRRDFECVGLDYNAFYPGETRLEALENLLNAPEQPAEYQVFFYHSDHLGSSSFITDINGDATQHLQYLPFGEDFVHQQNTAAYYTPYTFSGKERDLETNLSYFGARYYESSLSVWLSVDPMSEARPYLSPYNYCQLNPVMLVDPTGMLDDKPGDLVGEATSKDGGSVNFYNKFFSLKPGPENLPATMRPSSAEFDNNPMIAGNGGDDPPKKGTKSNTNPAPAGPVNTQTSQSEELFKAGFLLLAVPEGTVTKAGAFIIITAAGVVYLVENFDEIPNPFPGPWYTDRPNDYIPKTPSGINNKNYFPQGNGGPKIVTSAVRVAGAAAFAKRFGEGMRGRQDALHAPDATYVSPSPVRILKQKPQ